MTSFLPIQSLLYWKKTIFKSSLSIFLLFNTFLPSLYTPKYVLYKARRFVPFESKTSSISGTQFCNICKRD
jgi:hypothetical protein